VVSTLNGLKESLRKQVILSWVSTEAAVPDSSNYETNNYSVESYHHLDIVNYYLSKPINPETDSALSLKNC
jgi:hypothetical protein